MAIGDDAAAAGLQIFDGTELANRLAELLNVRGDDIAHALTQLAGKASVASVTAVQNGLAGKAPTLHTHSAGDIKPLGSSGALPVQGSFGATGNLQCNGLLQSTGSRNFQVATNYVSAYLDAGGYVGYAPSARRFKTDIALWLEDATKILGIEPVTYRLKTDPSADPAPLRIGFIAEDLVAAGLEELVPVQTDPDADDFGLPLTINYEFFTVALQLVARHQADQITALTVAVERLTDRIIDLEGGAA